VPDINLKDSLGDRIKRYERCSDGSLTSNMPVFIRVDGRAFHTWTRGMQRPFDSQMVAAMVEAAILTSREMQGFKLGYVQSDEATFMLTDTENIESQPWFDNRLCKLVSISAALMSVHFNTQFAGSGRSSAVFDSRAFNVPYEDAANVFVWRQRDWERNSIQMMAQAHFSHSQLQGKNHAELHEMLHEAGLNWAKLHPVLKNGTFFTKATDCTDKLIYSEINDLIGF
jgi:tRNA(His) guanylyltransferase